MLKQILPRIPDHDIYIEPFAGGLAVLLAKPRARVEVVNDLNSELVLYYRYVRHHPEALKAELAGRLNSRQDFEDLLTMTPITDLQRAVRWYLLKVCSFGAGSDSWGRAKTSYHGFDEERHLALIDAVAKRLRRVFIESKDWEEVVEFFDSPRSFTYFDPPYVTGDAGSYDAFSVQEMTRLRDRLQKMQGSWMLSCDASDQCRKIFAEFPAQEIPIKYAIDNRAGKRPTSYELLVMSPKMAQAARAA